MTSELRRYIYFIVHNLKATLQAWAEEQFVCEMEEVWEPAWRGGDVFGAVIIRARKSQKV